MAESFESSDALRIAKPLRHVKTVTFDKPLALEAGGTLPQVTVAYETYGQLNAARDNAILICHAISGDSHVARHDDADDPGWWDIAVGPGKPIDTDQYFVICPNLLGGCRGTTGPSSINPATGKPYGARFPDDHHRRHGRGPAPAAGSPRDRDSCWRVIGGSMGGHQALDVGDAAIRTRCAARLRWPPRRG